MQSLFFSSFLPPISTSFRSCSNPSMYFLKMTAITVIPYCRCVTRKRTRCVGIVRSSVGFAFKCHLLVSSTKASLIDLEQAVSPKNTCSVFVNNIYHQKTNRVHCTPLVTADLYCTILLHDRGCWRCPPKMTDQVQSVSSDICVKGSIVFTGTTQRELIYAIFLHGRYYRVGHLKCRTGSNVTHLCRAQFIHGNNAKGTPVNVPATLTGLFDAPPPELLVPFFSLNQVGKLWHGSTAALL